MTEPVRRLFAFVRQTDLHPPTRHFRGIPTSLHPDGASPEPEGWPIVVTIEFEGEGVFLDRFARDQSSVGDTWHQSLEDAKKQASIEYPTLLSEWYDVRSDLSRDDFVNDVIAKAIEGLRR